MSTFFTKNTFIISFRRSEQLYVAKNGMGVVYTRKSLAPLKEFLKSKGCDFRIRGLF